MTAFLLHARIPRHKRKIHHLFYYQTEHIPKAYKYYTMKVMAIKRKQYTHVRFLCWNFQEGKQNFILSWVTASELDFQLFAPKTLREKLRFSRFQFVFTLCISFRFSTFFHERIKMKNKLTKSHAERNANIWKIIIIFLSSLRSFFLYVLCLFQTHNSILPHFYEHTIENAFLFCHYLEQNEAKEMKRGKQKLYSRNYDDCY